MAKYISLLRGINVSGQKKIKMTDLALLYQKLGCTDVVTYIQSGNVIFDSDCDDKALIKSMIERAIEQQYTFDVPVEIRTAAQFNQVLQSVPFNNVTVENDGSKVLVTFLSQPPTDCNLLNDYVVAPEQLVIDGMSVFLYCPNGYGKSKLSNAFIEKKLGVSATTRNWKTISKLCELANGK